MSLWSRLINVFRGDELHRQIREEFESHIAQATAEGRDPAEARRAFGPVLSRMEESRDFRLIPWLDSVRGDTIFAARQLYKNKIASAAAILSLALAIGACTAAFRLVDALFLRPMPVRDPRTLCSVVYHGFDSRTGKPRVWSSNSYPLFRQMRDRLKDQAQLDAVSLVDRIDLTYGSNAEMEKAYRQSVSGSMFSNFGLSPSLGRLLTADDDLVPGSKPYAVLSYDYWTHRFGQDPTVIGRTFHMGADLYEIVGVASKGFTGTEPGSTTDLFVPTMMESGSINSDNSFWLRIFVRLMPGGHMESLRNQMDAIYQMSEKERAKSFHNFPKHLLDNYPNAHLWLNSAAEGASNLQTNYRSALIALCGLSAMVLLIACANVANLVSAQGAARGREMALRISLGAGRGRLVRMVAIESALLAIIASAVGALFAWRAAPFVAERLNPPANPVRLVLSADWTVVGFGLILTLGVTLLLGLMPALAASRLKPMNALKDTSTWSSKGQLMNVLIAGQVAFCFLVLFLAGLFAATFEKLTKQPVGFSAERLLLLDTVTQQPLPAVKWQQMVDNLRAAPGVQSAALEAWPLMSGTMHNDRISVNNSPPSEVLTFFLGVSPGWLGTMRIPMLSGRDFRDNDVDPSVAIVNETFARQYFEGANPVGRSFEAKKPDGRSVHFEIVGLVRDASYRSLREAMLPQAYVPIRHLNPLGEPQPMDNATIVVRVANREPATLSETLRRQIADANPDFRISQINSQLGLVEGQTVRERLLANLSLFFAVVALLLAAIGLYGVLSYLIRQRERELGIRIAVGARPVTVARLVTAQILAMVTVGVLAGFALGIACGRFVAALLYGVTPTDPSMLILPTCVLVASVLLATLPAVSRAVRIDPAIMLRSE